MKERAALNYDQALRQAGYAARTAKGKLEDFGEDAKDKY